MSVRNDITVKSTVRAIVVMNVPSLNLKRTWQKKGAIQKIPMDLLEQAIYDPGVEYLFKSGTLYIDDMEAKIVLGLEEPGTEEPTNVIALSTEDAEKLLKNTPLKDFREKVASLSHDQAVELANMAVDLKVTDYQRAQILKEKTEIDVFKAAVAAQEEADKTANN